MNLDAASVEECARMAFGGDFDTILLEELVTFEQPMIRQHLNDFIIIAESQNLPTELVTDRTAAFVYACARFGQEDSSS